MKDALKITDNSAVYKTLSKSEGGLSCTDNGLYESPFLVKNKIIYSTWRLVKLAQQSVNFENIVVKIKNLSRITLAEKTALLECCGKYNMAIYQLENTDFAPESLKIFAKNFGLERLDQHFCNDNKGITALQVSKQNNKGGFIPYSDKALNWHTDGYYNQKDQQVYAVLLHCDTPAREGGENWLMDHEMAYLRLRDENPAYIEALMNEDAMTIPAHIENGKILRSQQAGPVFSIYNQGRNLHMRYSQRKKNIIWRDDPMTKEAVGYLNTLLNETKQDALQIKLRKGQGILCNNVLHNRNAFKQEKHHSRLIYRGRFFDPIL